MFISDGKNAEKNPMCIIQCGYMAEIEENFPLLDSKSL